MNKKIRILSLDGGGIKGVITSVLLNNIEKMFQVENNNPDYRLVDDFDMVVGTSTGAIITALLLMNDCNGNLKYSTDDIVNLYMTEGSKIFKQDFWYKIKTIFGLFGAKYQSDSYESLLLKYFSDSKLSDLNKPSIITSYDTNKRKCVLFKQHHAIKNKSSDFYIREIVKASSSAPIYFTPTKMCSFSGDEYSLIDGGIYANNPAMCGFIEIDKLFKKEDGSNYELKDIQILSIGSGIYKKKYGWFDIRKWGIFRWIMPFIEMSMSAVNEITNYQLHRMFLLSNVSENYLRINVGLNADECKIDNIKKSNIDNLKRIGEETFLINKDIIKKFMNI